VEEIEMLLRTRSMRARLAGGSGDVVTDYS
jgi:hypothetical protein